MSHESMKRLVTLITDRQGKNKLMPRYENSWAVVIGIDNYANDIRPLTYAVRDADGFARILVEDLGFAKERVLVVLDPPIAEGERPYTLVAAQATKEVIERLLETDLPEKTRPDDRVLIFYAGHGERRSLPSGEQRGYLVPADAQTGAWHTFIKTDDILEAGDACKAKHVFYLLDACYSGLAFSRAEVEPSPYETTMLTNRARMALTAGTAKEAVNDKGPGGHSPFTWYVLQGLRGEARQKETGVMTGSDLMVYVKNEVGRNFGCQQTPDYGKLPGHESGGDFIFRLPAVIPTPELIEPARQDTVTVAGRRVPRLLLAVTGAITVMLLAVIIVLQLRPNPTPAVIAVQIATGVAGTQTASASGAGTPSIGTAVVGTQTGAEDTGWALGPAVGALPIGTAVVNTQTGAETTVQAAVAATIQAIPTPAPTDSPTATEPPPTATWTPSPTATPNLGATATAQATRNAAAGTRRAMAAGATRLAVTATFRARTESLNLVGATTMQGLTKRVLERFQGTAYTGTPQPDYPGTATGFERFCAANSPVDIVLVTGEDRHQDYMEPCGDAGRVFCRFLVAKGKQPDGRYERLYLYTTAEIIRGRPSVSAFISFYLGHVNEVIDTFSGEYDHIEQALLDESMRKLNTIVAGGKCVPQP